MDDQFIRLRWVAGNESIDIMKTKHVAVFGCGGMPLKDWFVLV